MTLFFRTTPFTSHDVNLNDLTAANWGDLFNFQFAAILPDDAFILISPADFSETALRPEQTKSISKNTAKCDNTSVLESDCVGSVVKQGSLLWAAFRRAARLKLTGDFDEPASMFQLLSDAPYIIKIYIQKLFFYRSNWKKSAEVLNTRQPAASCCRTVRASPTAQAKVKVAFLYRWRRKSPPAN